MSDTGSAAGGGRGSWAGIALALVAVVVVVVLMTRSRTLTPFMIDSTAPEGYRAVATLWEQEGARVDPIGAASLLDAGSDPSGDEVAAGDRVVVVPTPGYASEDELRALRELAEAGGTVVLGEPWPLEGVDSDEWDQLEEYFVDPAGTPFLGYGARELADTPALPQEPGRCDIPALEGLGPIDVAFAWSFPAAEGDLVCYGDPEDSYGSASDIMAVFSVRQVGAGQVVTLASPYLWVNARLQPAKEQGGRPLANAATALALTGAAPGVRIEVVDPVPSPDASFDGTKSTVELLPTPVKLALAQLLVVLLLFLWWRSVRLGRVVPEPLPVEIAGSELVVAIGDLLRRKGNPERAAATLRGEARAVLAQRLGAVGASDQVLVVTVAARSARPEAEVAAALLGGAPVTSNAELVQLARTLDSIRTEVLGVPTST